MGTTSGDTAPDSAAPHPGSPTMPCWNVGELVDAPRFTWRNWFALLGPGLVMGGAAIGGGEWLVGPLVTAKYGGALMWLALVSILGQVIYNIEISRYTLYSGEPIFTGKFRTLPGPLFWLGVYLILDFGSVFPYLAANAATPIEVVILGGDLPHPDPGDLEHVAWHWWMHKGLSCAIFLLALIPLIVGGKIYNSLRKVMTFKIFVVLGFLTFLAVLYSHPSTWTEIVGGFFKFGNVPIQRAEDLNQNRVLDPGEDWDGDGHLDVVEPRHPPSIDTTGDGKPDDWPKDAEGRPIKFEDIDGDGFRDGDNIDNIFVALLTRGEFPDIDWTLIGFIAALAAIAGAGGLSNTPVSNYTRDQGWGMGWKVGAIPSVVGGHDIKLSHVGTVFEVGDESLPRWRRWYRHVARDQLAVWMPACVIGIALPSMLSVQFLRRGTDADNWTAAAMTADGVGEQAARPPEDVLASVTGFSDWFSGEGWGNACWAMTLFCGFLVLGPSMASTADGIIRRWVDVVWTASGRLRALDPHKIRLVYFFVLIVYAGFGVVMLWLNRPDELLRFATTIYNFALGFSCWHTLVVNSVLLPRELRPGWFVRIALLLAGAFFTLLATVVMLHEFGVLGSA